MCAEFFHPSVGGVQEVVKQIAIRLAAKGHEITIATSKIPNRKFNVYKKIKIKSFSVSGNFVSGIIGEVQEYKNFVKFGDFDILFIYAAQQWTFDVLIDIFDEIKAKKVFVPCGFSCLFDDNYERYFQRFPSILKKFNSLIFHSTKYRDYIFAKNHNIRNLSFIPNGADNYEFNKFSRGFRKSFNISKNDLLLMTNGTINGAKGHLEVAQAYALLDILAPTKLILNGNKMPSNKIRSIFNIKNFNLINLLRLIFHKSYFKKLNILVREVNAGKFGKNKKIYLTDLPRNKLISCYFESNLFVFASNVEYSPLVLFEANAAGLPFLSSDVGNSAEIAKWTGGGKVLPSTTSINGNSSVDIDLFSKEIKLLLEDKNKLNQLSKNGRNAWREKFNWDTIALMYESIFKNLITSSAKKDK